MINEQLSAWLDGEAAVSDSGQILESAARQPGQRKACALCWLIGDILRDEPPLSSDFTQRVMANLDAGPTVLAPVTPVVSPAPAFRWMQLAAALAGAVVAAWAGFSVWQGDDMTQQAVASSPAALPTASVASQGLDGDRSYLIAHQASSMGLPMAGVAQYIRTVGDEQVGVR